MSVRTWRISSWSHARVFLFARGAHRSGACSEVDKNGYLAAGAYLPRSVEGNQPSHLKCQPPHVGTADFRIPKKVLRHDQPKAAYVLAALYEEGRGDLNSKMAFRPSSITGSVGIAIGFLQSSILSRLLGEQSRDPSHQGTDAGTDRCADRPEERTDSTTDQGSACQADPDFCTA
jgi:hypothetical protein